VSAARDPNAGFTFGAPLTCPSCRHKFTGCWVGTKVAAQHCPACGHTWRARWPDFRHTPKTAIVRAGGGDDGAA
jgi:Zn ribbon nucleic-acid-binding protein